MKLPHNVITRSPTLLPLLYKPAELADELKVPRRTLYDWLKYGAPHQRDELNLIWIEGRAFAAWVEANRKKKAATILSMPETISLKNCSSILNL